MTPAIDDEIELLTDHVERALKLAIAQQQKLAGLLQEAKDDPEVVRSEWKAEIERRIDGYLDGSIPTEDWRVAFERSKEEYLKKFSQ